MKPHIRLLVVGVALTVVALVLFRLHSLPPPITADVAARIKPGMSYRDVVAILGPPRLEPDFGPIPLEMDFEPPVKYPAGAVLWDEYRWQGEFDLVMVTVDPKLDAVTSVDISKHGEVMQQHDIHWHIRRALGRTDTPTPPRQVPARP